MFAPWGDEKLSWCLQGYRYDELMSLRFWALLYGNLKWMFRLAVFDTRLCILTLTGKYGQDNLPKVLQVNPSWFHESLTKAFRCVSLFTLLRENSIFSDDHRTYSSRWNIKKMSSGSSMFSSRNSHSLLLALALRKSCFMLATMPNFSKSFPILHKKLSLWSPL